MKINQFNVFLEISDPLCKDLIKFSLKYKDKYNSFFVINGMDMFPHLSLYLFTTLSKNKQKVLNAAKEIARKLKPFEAEIEKFIATESGLIMAEFKDSKTFRFAHEEVLKTFNPLRENTQRKKYMDLEYVKTLPTKDQTYLEKYGHKCVLDMYRPHLSISHIENPDDQKKVLKELTDNLAGAKTGITALKIIEDDYDTSNAKEIIFEQKLTS